MRPGKSENTNMQIKGQKYNDTKVIFFLSIKQQTLYSFYFVLVHQWQQGIIFLIFLSYIVVSDKTCIFAYRHTGYNVQKVEIH